MYLHQVDLYTLAVIIDYNGVYVDLISTRLGAMLILRK